MSFHARGLLLMIGPFADAGAESAMAVFTTRDAAEEFVKADPSSSTESPASGPSANGTRPSSP